MHIAPAEPLEPSAERPGMSGRTPVATDELVVGEWSLRAAAWTDRHLHTEVNVVLEGELRVTSGGVTRVAGPGDTVVADAGDLVRYEAPAFARMLYVYGPSSDGHATHDAGFEALD